MFKNKFIVKSFILSTILLTSLTTHGMENVNIEGEKNTSTSSPNWKKASCGISSCTRSFRARNEETMRILLSQHYAEEHSVFSFSSTHPTSELTSKKAAEAFSTTK